MASRGTRAHPFLQIPAQGPCNQQLSSALSHTCCCFPDLLPTLPLSSSFSRYVLSPSFQVKFPSLPSLRKRIECSPPPLPPPSVIWLYKNPLSSYPGELHPLIRPHCSLSPPSQQPMWLIDPPSRLNPLQGLGVGVHNPHTTPHFFPFSSPSTFYHTPCLETYAVIAWSSSWDGPRWLIPKDRI